MTDSDANQELDAFHKAVESTMQALRNLAEAVKATPLKHGRTPSALSKAAKELEYEAGYSSRCDWQTPVNDTFNTAGFALHAASDHALSFGALFDGNHIAVYSQMTVARALLEACTVSWWLDDPDIKTHQRVQRGLSEQLYSAHQLEYLGMDATADAARMAFWNGVAEKLNWTVSDGRGGKQMVNGVCRPNVETAIDVILESETRHMGHQLFCLYSAVTHATWYGLFEGVRQVQGRQDGALDALVGTRSTDVERQAWVAMVALRRTAQRRFELMGWVDAEWERIVQQTRAYELHLARRLVGYPSPN